MKKPRVAIIMGSKSDLETMQEAAKILEKFKVSYEMRVLSAHRTPNDVAKFAESAKNNNIKVIIAGAGGAAALAGVIAAHTTLPVIGVPIETKSLKGLDSLLSTVQMPSGIPVASMAIGSSGAKNAAIFALEILATADKSLSKKLERFKKDLAREVRKISVIKK
jgi:phosphoribosylaminoimidazole carboxylase PurE protein